MTNLITTQEAANLVGLKIHTIRQRAQRGTFPRPVVPGKSKQQAQWDRAEIEAWKEKRKDLITMSEAARWLGYQKQDLYGWRKKKPFPTPVLKENNKIYYTWQDIQEWASDFVEWEENND